MREQQKEKVSKSEATGTVVEDPEGAGLHGFPISSTDAPPSVWREHASMRL